MNILGINAFHGDSSACIVQNGKLIAAIEEERFNRIKHWAGFPEASVRFCLEEAGIKVEDLQHVAVSFDPKANLTEKLKYTIKQRPSLNSLLDRFSRQRKSASLKSYLAKACDVDESSITATIHQVEHHNCHMAHAFNLSPFEEASILSIDGMGDFVSMVMASGEGTQIKPFARTHYPHSLGFLYNAITLYLGFPNYGDEYKVMGLAPYGKPAYVDAFRKIISPKTQGFELDLKYFTHQKEGINMSWENGAPSVQPFHSNALEELLGPARKPKEELTDHHQNIATSLQAVTEEILFHLLTELHKASPSDNLCIAGGVAMNSVANGKIARNTPFKNVYSPVGAADNGTCIGAAYHIWNQELKQPRTFKLEHGYLGSSFSDEACKAAAMECGVKHEALNREDLINRVVEDLCNGKVVGWFQGRMEFGARALGNRTLLADPRRTDMRDIINLKIKFREKFRPFAPSILEEHVSDYFEVNEPSPFMERVLPIRPEKHAEIPAVTHVDGSGRLQTVSKKTNPLYWDLIHAFYQKTGVPIVLNTSLNENEPIVRTPQEAINCFLRTKMDHIVVGAYYCSRT
ncbi:MAG: carbamoyltransferase [Cryomorphaceae bacterium]|nr:MAG: carbamoyltransferase [Cryomorphaceae bacterium]